MGGGSLRGYQAACCTAVARHEPGAGHDKAKLAVAPPGPYLYRQLSNDETRGLGASGSVSGLFTSAAHLHKARFFTHIPSRLILRGLTVWCCGVVVLWCCGVVCVCVCVCVCV